LTKNPHKMPLFTLWTFFFICSNISTAPIFEVFISHLIRYFRACGYCQVFVLYEGYY